MSDRDRSRGALTRDEEQIPIVQDSRFVRLYGDAFMPFPLVNGFDLAILVASPSVSGSYFSSLADENGVERLSTSAISVKSTFAEVARLRLDNEGFENLLRVVIGAAVNFGVVDAKDIAGLAQRLSTSTEDDDAGQS